MNFAAHSQAPPIYQHIAAGLWIASSLGMHATDEQLAIEILNAARAVHSALGPGFVEPVYNKALGIELRNRGLMVEREKLIRVVYISNVVGRHYLDLVVENRVIIELKAMRTIIPVHEAQMRSYLTATNYPFGVIVNFGTVELEWKQISGSKL